MADVELASVNNSGNLTNFQKGGVDVGDKLLSSDEVDVKIKVTDDKLVDYVKRDGTNTVEKTLYNPLLIHPAYAEANMYYDIETGTMDVQGAYSDVTLQIGRETHFEVINNTGVTITNGSVVRQNGVSGGDVQIALALADTFQNATIIGMATHDIINGAKGIITTFGQVGDIDTSGLAQGVPSYLSDTIAGTLTNTAPDIATQVGGVLIVDAVAGKFFVSVVNTKNLPTVLAILNDQTLGNETYTVGATPTAIINYNAGGNILIPESLLLGTITPLTDGTYRASLNATYSFASTASTRKIKFEVYNKTDAVVVKSTVKNIPRDADQDSVTFNPAVSLLANKEYQIIMSSSTGNIDITFSDITYDIESLHIR